MHGRVKSSGTIVSISGQSSGVVFLLVHDRATVIVHGRAASASAPLASRCWLRIPARFPELPRGLVVLGTPTEIIQVPTRTTQSIGNINQVQI